MSPDLISAVQNASTDPVIAAGSRLCATRRAFPFVDRRSPIRDYRAQEFIEGNLSLHGPWHLTVFDEIENYLVLASCCHTLEGWRFLSKAALALLDGARNAAVHLAYYAELRAAFGILASAGIGILNNSHFSLDIARRCHRFKGPTHTVVWDALEVWSSLPTSTSSVLDSIHAQDLTGETWADACRLTAYRQTIARRWLTRWSCDLRYVRRDHDLRKRASYRADLRRRTIAPLLAPEIQLLMNANRACLSEENGYVQAIDDMLIHDLCVRSLAVTRISETDLWNAIEHTLVDQQGLPADSARSRTSAIRDAPTGAGGEIVSCAHPRNRNALGVFCRALLLLRLASALKRSLWRAISLRSPDGHCPWQAKLLRDFAINSHLRTSASAGSYLDLAQDQTDAIEDVDDYLSTRAFDSFGIWRDRAAQLVGLCRFERAALWTASL